MNPANPSTTTVYDLVIPSADFSTVTSLLPYHFAGLIYALASDGTDSAVYGFNFMGVTAASITGNRVGQKLIGVVLNSVHGTPNLIYTHVEKGFLNTAARTLSSTTIDPTYTVVNSYLFYSGFSLVTATTPAGTAGDLYFISGSQATKLTYTGTTTTPYLDFGDNLNNFVRIG